MGIKPVVYSLSAKLPSKFKLRRGFLILLLVCGIFFVVAHHVIKGDPGADTEITDPYKSAGLILDTPGCRIPKLDPYDKSVRGLIVSRHPYICSGMPVFMITKPNATIVLNKTVLNIFYKVSPENVSCFYKAIYKQMEPKGSVRENTIFFGVKKVLKFGVPLQEEFLQVECKVGEQNFIQYIPLVPIKSHVEMNKPRTTEQDALNIVLIGIDSVSKLNFLRHFKKTHHFITLNLSAFDMKGYTKVGDNTFPNLTPLLTGHFVEHYWNEKLKNQFYFDNLDFIWKLYSSKGYRTLYAEDGVYTGTFNYLKRGFKNQPTDYYSRPLGLAMAESKLKKKGFDYCLNNQLEMEIFYRYLIDFLETMENRPSFSFTMVSSLTHDYLNEAGYADEPTYNLLKNLYDNGVMNKSLVVIFSDHGLRFGAIRETYVGKFEERMPFMYLTFPKWFLDKNVNIAKNLKLNQNRLITLFDLHSTLYHLLNTSGSISEEQKSAVTPNGLSLMSEISIYRTCEMAKILPHWCPCQVYQYIPKSGKIATKVATAIINEINQELKPVKDRCAQLKIDKITDARLGQANNLVLRYVRQESEFASRNIVYGDKVNTLSDYLVTLRARPGGGMLEGTVRYDAKNGTMKVLGISRINLYGTQSSCINSQALKKFCFCK